MCWYETKSLLEDLQDRTAHVHDLMTKLRDGTDSVRVLTSDTRSVSGIYPTLESMLANEYC